MARYAGEVSRLGLLLISKGRRQQEAAFARALRSRSYFFIFQWHINPWRAMETGLLFFSFSQNGDPMKSHFVRVSLPNSRL